MQSTITLWQRTQYNLCIVLYDGKLRTVCHLGDQNKEKANIYMHQILRNNGNKLLACEKCYKSGITVFKSSIELVSSTSCKCWWFMDRSQGHLSHRTHTEAWWEGQPLTWTLTPSLDHSIQDIHTTQRCTCEWSTIRTLLQWVGVTNYTAKPQPFHMKSCRSKHSQHHRPGDMIVQYTPDFSMWEPYKYWNRHVL